MGKFVMFILISMCILGSCRDWLSNEIYFTPPSLFISLFLNFSLTRRKCSRKSSTCSNWIKSHFDTDAKQWKSQRKNVLIFRVRVGGSTLGFLFFLNSSFPQVFMQKDKIVSLRSLVRCEHLPLSVHAYS